MYFDSHNPTPRAGRWLVFPRLWRRSCIFCTYSSAKRRRLVVATSFGPRLSGGRGYLPSLLESRKEIDIGHSPRIAFRSTHQAMFSTLIGNPAPAFTLPCTRFPDPARNSATIEDYKGR